MLILFCEVLHKEFCSLVSGCVIYGLRAQQSRLQLYGDIMVWYNMFILFVMYCMMPVPVKWCTVCCLLTALVHIVLMASITSSSQSPQPSVSQAFYSSLVGFYHHF